MRTWGIRRWERCGPEWIGPWLSEEDLAHWGAGGENRGCVCPPQWRPTAPHARPSRFPSYTETQWWFYPPAPRPRPLPADTHSLPERRFWALWGWAAFHFHVPSIQQHVGMWWAPRNVCWVSEWVDAGWSRGEWGGARWILMILRISQSLPCAEAVKAIEAVEVEGQGYAVLFQRDSLVTLGWKGRPVPAHTLHATGLCPAQRLVLWVC